VWDSRKHLYYTTTTTDNAFVVSENTKVILRPLEPICKPQEITSRVTRWLDRGIATPHDHHHSPLTPALRGFAFSLASLTYPPSTTDVHRCSAVQSRSRSPINSVVHRGSVTLRDGCVLWVDQFFRRVRTYMSIFRRRSSTQRPRATKGRGNRLAWIANWHSFSTCQGITDTAGYV
jgi:hypothetical protein